MIITQARIEDLEDILTLEQCGFAVGERWSSTTWEGELAAPDRCVLTHADGSGKLLGVATFRRAEDMADLDRVIVHPHARGRGIAAALLRAGLEWAEAIGANRMLLEVRRDNTAAVGLYRRLGFDQVSQRRDYYGPGQDALVMLRPVGEEFDAWAVVG